MESLPWQGLTAAAGGWVLFGSLSWLVLRKFIAGDIITRREADAKDAEVLRLRESNDYLQEQLGESLKALTVASDAIAGLRAAAEERLR